MTEFNGLADRLRSVPGSCAHSTSDDYEIAGLKRSRCRQCGWVSIAFVDEGRGGALFTVPREADR